MDCRLPPPLSEDELSQALDGTASQRVLDHLTQCEGCAIRLKEAQQFEAALKMRLSRMECPDASALGDYHFGLLSKTQAQVIESHLGDCPHCRAELDDLRAFLRLDVAPPQAKKPKRPVVKPAARRNWLQELTAALLPPAPQPVLRGGESDARIIRAQAEDGTIVRLAVSTNDGIVTLQGQIIGDPEVWVGALVEVRQAGQLLVVTPVQASGQFRFEIAASGAISLRITAETGPVLLVEAFDPGES